MVGELVSTFNVIPFALDQMPSASSEEIRAMIHWYYWTKTVGSGAIGTFLLYTKLNNKYNYSCYIGPFRFCVYDCSPAAAPCPERLHPNGATQ